ncbi:vacuolar ATP synthase [Aureobasidium pullulans]|uniref:V-type proton ATPase subunit F n=2 Tax=Aureobasidium pullulans TaxID=5580 RepID=A0A074XL55_AURPU|nr:vacuolar ATP synthase [Aureobasidium pullulans EXF-150]THW00278.1 vacuolar ATP synthase [Aureobasidium pullulans]KEQ86245.1 vacuolar ATP synthase [Aureobasidium pullulans EXF-150]THW39875.1 vacuolar ATP synthase [Aureobasidium pullulans]THY01212.1 vacuolar ATP synthase [Aureobasidium pullulans]THY13788.1 vacuolar ATP synthase [Aureobasidium pullulans]
MALPQSAYKDRQFLAVIGDEDSVTGVLLAGVGHVTDPPDSQKNYLVVDHKTETSAIEEAFDSFTQERKDIAILLINQHVIDTQPGTIAEILYSHWTQIADKIRSRVDAYTQAFPSLLEIPSKDHPYDPEKDSVMKRVKKLFGE